MLARSRRTVISAAGGIFPGGAFGPSPPPMKKNPLNLGMIDENSRGIGPVSSAMVRDRAREIAQIAGRGASHVTPADYEQARRELAGEAESDPRTALLESAPESDRWNPVPGSSGHQAPESASEDEDEEGRSESEQLAEEGVGEAERDQMLQAAREAEKADRQEADEAGPRPGPTDAS